MDDQFNHELYKKVDDPKDAEAHAWVFKNKDEFVPYYFNFPELEDGEIRAKVLYTGVCHSDTMKARGSWGPCPYPLCAGHEVIAEVTKVGSAVKDRKVGQLIGWGPFREHCGKCELCQNGRSNICFMVKDKEIYGRHFGGFASHMQAPADCSFTIPEGLDIKNSPPLLCAGVTVYNPITRYFKKGQKIGIVGIGGLGHLAIQIASKLGMEVYGFTSSENKRQFIKDLGAKDAIVVDKDFDNLKQWAFSFDGLLYTIPASNPEMLKAYSSVLKCGGNFAFVGIPAGGACVEIPFTEVVVREVNIVGSFVGSIEKTQEMLEFCAKNDVNVMAEHFSFDDFPKALNRLENERPKFRCVVDTVDYNKKHFSS